VLSLTSINTIVSSDLEKDIDHIRSRQMKHGPSCPFLNSDAFARFTLPPSKWVLGSFTAGQQEVSTDTCQRYYQVLYLGYHSHFVGSEKLIVFNSHMANITVIWPQQLHAAGLTSCQFDIHYEEVSALISSLHVHNASKCKSQTFPQSISVLFLPFLPPIRRMTQPREKLLLAATKSQLILTVKCSF